MTYKLPTVVAGTSGRATGSVTITKPAAARFGDLLVLVVSANANLATITAPDDFTGILPTVRQGDVCCRVWHHFVSNADPASYTVTVSASVEVLYNLVIVRGANPWTMIDTYNSVYAATTLPYAEPGVTTTVDNCLAVGILVAEDSPRTIVQPTDWTLLESRNGTAGTISMAVATKGIATAGASGGADWTATDSTAGDLIAITIAFRPGVMSRSNSVLYEPQQLLAKTLADCTEFRNLVGATSHDAAQARIWHESLPRPTGGRDAYTLAEWKTYRPFALIFTTDVDGAISNRIGTMGPWSDRGTLRILIEMETPEALAYSPVLLDHLVKQTIGRIKKRPPDESSSDFFGLEDLAHRTNETAGYSYLAIDQVGFRGWSRSADKEKPGAGDYLFAWLEVTYGHQG